MYEEKVFAVYIMTNYTNSVLYTGMTSNLIGRVMQHQGKVIDGFTKKYNCVKLVYYEICDTAEQAVMREHQIKAGSRKKKLELIESKNPGWRDLFDDLYD